MGYNDIHDEAEAVEYCTEEYGTPFAGEGFELGVAWARGRILAKLKDWLDNGSTDFSGTAVAVNTDGGLYMRGDLPEAVAAMLGLIDVEETL